MVVRNDVGKLIWLSSSLLSCRSALEAELEALRWASELAEHRNWRNIIWEVDASEVAKVVCSTEEPTKVVCSTEEPTNWFTYHKILELRKRFNRADWSLRWLSRISNGVADSAAKFTLSFNCRLSVDEFNLETLPFGILDLLSVEQTAAL
ncbi:hypothetical protein FNV43_RR01307 [Rhamnella rubrinervis]|uniref:RNase H type-1 domain-containing protein n=1 Tax=Rhamnella rubrinervis TaxID=2594499 RepID=A0A8K0MSU5_9ROSA|nr:hypothetical protein FNV43_RR01307 [Rhamnella rubrinervis]